MTDQEQRDVFIRGGMIAVVAVTASVSLPAISQQQADLRADAEFRAEAGRLAMYEDGGLAVRTASHTPGLLDTPWLRTVEYTLKRDIDSSMSRYAMRDRDGAALASLASFRPDQIQRAETIDAELMCMAQAVYYESGHEPVEGQLAVAEVISNRVRDHRYPDTVCDVVFQGATRTTGCQFTFTCDGAMKKQPVGEAWERSRRVAAHVMMGLNEDRTDGATHYHATYVDPVWNAGLIKTKKVGLHIFYRFPRGAEWASVERNFEARKRQTELRLAALDAAKEADMAALDEGLLFADASSAADDTYYTVTPTVAPAGVTTSTRTVQAPAPRLMSVQTVKADAAVKPAVAEAAPAPVQENAEAGAEVPAAVVVDEYMARQIAQARATAGQ
ncbi:cell wall hydrolase [Hyphomonas sediminis]|uniref:cell wall hydrolase n=1 Tax=Hyphomonas sediminis TaxID=2866160 RepID=UPI001CEC2BB2|nr:cell wall hydrolase [Hyphomonas sediminis]